MTPLVPIMMFGWVFLTIGLFVSGTPRRAVLISIIGGVLFLPMWTYDFPGIPNYDKSTSIAIGLVVGTIVSGSKSSNQLKMTIFDLPMILWCFAAPIATSLSNGLGLYNGVSGLIQNYLAWGVFFWAGRRFFGDPDSMRTLAWAVIIGGLLYVPLILFEVRMSPKLSKMIYGFFPHSFLQHIRYGGFRPIVFMQHGLMVALWMAVSTTVTFWMWRSKEFLKVKGIPMSLCSIAMIGSTILCKSANGIIFMSLGILSYFYYKKAGTTRLLRLVLFFIPVYVTIRVLNVITVTQVLEFMQKLFDAERIESLMVRLVQENLFGDRTLLRPVFGWGGFGRGWPIDPTTGQLIGWVDSLWVVLSNTYGIFGLAVVFLSLGIGPFCVLTYYSRGIKLSRDDSPVSIPAIVLSMGAAFFLFDSLLNAMINPVYIMCAGALVSYYQRLRGTAPDYASESTAALPSVC